MAAIYLSRAQKAERILDNGGVHPVNALCGRWDVDSESREIVYAVNLHRNECGCEDHARGNRCKHIIAAEKAAEIYARKPVVETPKSLDGFLAWATS